MSTLAHTDTQAADRRRALLALAAISVTARVAFSAAADIQTAGNAAWLQALLFPAVCLPGASAFFYCAGREVPRPTRTAVCVLFFPLFTAECSSWMYALCECVAYTTFSDMPLLALLMPALAVSAWAASQGGDACGGLGRVQLAVIPWCFLLSAVWQARDMRPVYLTPILGGGLRAIVRGAYLCAGAGLSLPAGLWLMWGAGRQRVPAQERRAALKAMPLCALAAAGMLLTYGMLAPNYAGSPHTPTIAMERLLMGGGTGTSVQFLLMLVWYSLFLAGGVFSCCAAAHAMNEIVPRWSMRACSWIAAIVCLALVPVWMRYGTARESMLAWRWPLITAGLALCALTARSRERRDMDAL